MKKRITPKTVFTALLTLASIGAIISIAAALLAVIAAASAVG